MTIYDFLPKFIKKVIADPAKKTVTADYWNELFNILVEQGDHSQESIQVIINQLKTNVLLKDNTTAWEPTGEYEPVTRKFVTDRIVAMGGGNMMSSTYDPDNNGVVVDSDKLGGQLPAYYATGADITEVEGSISATNLNLTNHAGVTATDAINGHVIIENNLLRSSYVAGKVLSSHQGYLLDDKIAKIVNGTTTVTNATNATNAGNAATVDGVSIWRGPLASKGTDANTIYFCY